MTEITGMAGTMQLFCNSDLTQTKGAPVAGQNAEASALRRELNTVRTGAAGSSLASEGREACKPPTPPACSAVLRSLMTCALCSGRKMFQLAGSNPGGRSEPLNNLNPPLSSQWPDVGCLRTAPGGGGGRQWFEGAVLVNVRDTVYRLVRWLGSA